MSNEGKETHRWWIKFPVVYIPNHVFTGINIAKYKNIFNHITNNAFSPLKDGKLTNYKFLIYLAHPSSHSTRHMRRS
jgi:hypothetical protein